jgi:branched-chain amino acid transport system ATP-binding protein
VTASALDVRGVTAGYGDTVVLRDVSLHVPVGQVVALLGANGAGKTTTMRVLSGLLEPSVGSVHLGDVDVSQQSAAKRARAGLCLIPEGRGIFRNLTVAENLRLQVPPWLPRDTSVSPVIEAFPILGSRFGQLAGNLSGGQQQMLALGRALISKPKVVLLDEVSMGLSPIIVDEVFVVLTELAAAGTAMLIVEQYARRALKLADLVVILDKGGVVFSGPPSSLESSELARSYLGSKAT